MFAWLKRRTATAFTSSSEQLWDEEFQRKLEMLSLAARRLSSGKDRGERRAKKIGGGVEFADHREYVAGDDFRFLDWKVYARSDRMLLRLFEEEEDLSVYVVLDTSSSMDMGKPNKLAQAKRIAAALSFVALASLDRVSVVTFADGLRGRTPIARGKGRIFPILDFLERAKAGGKTSMEQGFRTFVAENKRRGLVIVVSDLYDPQGFERGLDILRFARFGVAVVHIVDPLEASPPVRGDVVLIDRETGERREVTVTPAVLERYRQAHRLHLESAASYCKRKHIPHVAVPTDIPWDDAVLRVLRHGGIVG